MSGKKLDKEGEKVVEIHFLGTCSGTEPQPNRRHTALILEYQEKLFWFDAGESCGYTAHLLGLDLLQTEAVFVSHPHMDHIGGLPHLIWTLKKLESLSKVPLRTEIDLYFPDLNIWYGLEKMLFLKGRTLKNGLGFCINLVTDGVIYAKNDLMVSAVHNLHLGKPESKENWQSFSFLIEAADKRIVYSGDFKAMRELEPLFVNEVDLLLVETGHHSVEEVCNYLVENQKPVGQLGFIHHGRAILNNPEEEMKKAKTIFGSRVFFADDKMSLTF